MKQVSSLLSVLSWMVDTVVSEGKQWRLCYWAKWFLSSAAMGRMSVSTDVGSQCQIPWKKISLPRSKVLHPAQLLSSSTPFNLPVLNFFIPGCRHPEPSQLLTPLEAPQRCQDPRVIMVNLCGTFSKLKTKDPALPSHRGNVRPPHTCTLIKCLPANVNAV